MRKWRRLVNHGRRASKNEGENKKKQENEKQIRKRRRLEKHKRRAVPKLLKMAVFGQKNGTSDAQIQKRRPLFVANYPQIWCNRLWFRANFENRVF